ncbi:MAG TPA: tetratricopeptide repeat protein [Myxococcota bacterium]|nr:tetratricopeptide repeat protein [Myxococcota bacterium]
MKRKSTFIVMMMAVVIAQYVIAADVISPAELKKRGNDAFKNEDFQAAVKLYSEAIDIEAGPSLYKNRGLALIRLERFADAEDDLNKVLSYDAKDGKALYWLGYIAFHRSLFTKSIHYLRQVDGDAVAQELLKQATAQFLSRVGLMFDAVTKSPPLFVRAAFKRNLENLNIAHADRMEELCVKSTSSLKIWNVLDMCRREKKFVPMESFENPKQIAEILGSGRRVATAALPALPLYLSERFEHVNVYDSAKEQHEFNRALLGSIQENVFDSFLLGVKQSFKAYVDQNERKIEQPFERPTPEEIDAKFRFIYDGINANKIRTNIASEQVDIFSAVNNESLEQKHDVVYLGKISSEVILDWPSKYGYIRQWLKQGKTVVYTLLHGALASDGIVTQLTEGFDDVACSKFASFEDSPLLVYVILKPKVMASVKL